jgi:hypothetical protein
MNEDRCVRALASGATELRAADVRPGHRLDRLGDAASELERPLHVAWGDEPVTLCGTSTRDLREYPVEFASLAPHIKCPLCAGRFSQHTVASGRQSVPNGPHDLGAPGRGHGL